MALREVLVALGFEFDKKQEESVLSAISGIKKAAAALGVAFGVHEITKFVEATVHEVAAAGAEIGHMAERLGVGAEELQVLGSVAKKSGSSMGEMGISLRTLSRHAYDAKNGSKAAARSFDAIGVSVTNANGELKPSSELMIEMADRFASMTNESERTALAQEVFGRAGAGMIPILLKGSDALRQQIKLSKELGNVMSDKDIAASKDFEEAQIDQEKAVMGLKRAFAVELIPVFTDMAKASTELIKKFKPLAKMIGTGLAEAIKIARNVMLGLGQAAQAIGSVIASLGPVIGTLTVAVTALTVASTLFGFKAVVAWLMALAPLLLMIVLFGIIAAAIFLLIDDFVEMGKGHESMTGTMVEGVTELIAKWGDVGTAIGEMLDTALRFWLGFFGLSKDEADNWIEALTNSLMNFWPELIDGWKKIFMDFFGFLGEGLGSLLGLGKRGEFGGARVNPAGITTANAMLPGGGAGGNSSSFSPNTNVSIAIDASGSTSSPEQISSAMGSELGSVLEDQYRQAGQALAVSMP